jgi:hypothetical protein
MLVYVALRRDYIALCCPGHYYGSYAGYDKRAASGVFRLWKTSFGIFSLRESFGRSDVLLSENWINLHKTMEGRFKHDNRSTTTYP